MTDSPTSLTDSTTSPQVIDAMQFELMDTPEKVTCMRDTLWALRDSVLAVEMAHTIEYTTHAEVDTLLQLDGHTWNDANLDEKINKVKNAMWVVENHLMNVYNHFPPGHLEPVQFPNVVFDRPDSLPPVDAITPIPPDDVQSVYSTEVDDSSSSVNNMNHSSALSEPVVQSDVSRPNRVIEFEDDDDDIVISFTVKRRRRNTKWFKSIESDGSLANWIDHWTCNWNSKFGFACHTFFVVRFFSLFIRSKFLFDCDYVFFLDGSTTLPCFFLRSEYPKGFFFSRQWASCKWNATRASY